MTPDMPSPSLPSAGGAERPRAEARFAFHTRIRLEVAVGESICGWTADVSMSGAFMETDTSNLAVQVGDKGVVFLEMREGGASYEVSFPCTVARVNARGIGLDFESEQ
ncbi:MAG: PilZ domain-containing protein [Magnetococcales bacterium]|nr:PilZ domain-containing protein [Magnetococcales bacterium]NGZ06676.1 PilZ domain-containing protein [Magnetococcales bacterium]